MFLFSVIVGLVYMLMAIGFNLVLGVSRIVNLAYGAQIILTSYIASTLLSFMPAAIALPISVLLSLVIGAILWLVLWIFRKDLILSIVVSIAVALLIEGVLLKIYGARLISLVIAPGDIMGISAQWVIAAISSIASLAAFYMMMSHTMIGKRMAAVAENEDLARYMGINVRVTSMLSFVIASLFASIASIAITPLYAIYPHVGWYYLTVVLAVVIVGGLGSVLGALASSMILSFTQFLAAYYIGSPAKDLIPLAILISVLLMRPEGIFGRGVRWA
ncbi:MAG TPA: branched-chain amino acid ABC transporter permease [Sulfolobales archaeon]|nr:branched-chain amino acid ABC transporter permease [Sulfolobales archaeon]